MALALELRAQLRVGYPVALFEVGDVFVDLPIIDLVLVLLDLALQQALRDNSLEHCLGLRRIQIAGIVQRSFVDGGKAFEIVNGDWIAVDAGHYPIEIILRACGARRRDQ